MTSKGRNRKIKINETFRKIFEYDMKMESKEIKKAERSREIKLAPVIKYQDKYIDDWKAGDFVEYIHEKVSDRFGSAYISPIELRKRSIVKNGVKVLGQMMKIKNTKMQKEKYKDFVDWLLEKFVFSKTVNVGNFVSKATFRNYIMDMEKKKESGTVMGGEDVDYSKDVEVSF